MQMSFWSLLLQGFTKLMGGRRPLLNSYQSSLPKLPLPALRDTMKRVRTRVTSQRTRRTCRVEITTCCVRPLLDQFERRLFSNSCLRQTISCAVRVGSCLQLQWSLQQRFDSNRSIFASIEFHCKATLGSSCSVAHFQKIIVRSCKLCITTSK